MNFNYKELSKKIYSTIVLNDTRTTDELEKCMVDISDILKEEVAKVKRADKYQRKIKEQQVENKSNKIIFDNPNDILNIENPNELFGVNNVTENVSFNNLEQMIYQDQEEHDSIVIINDSNEIEVSSIQKRFKVYQPPLKIVDDSIKRFQVKVKINSSLKIKPRFQVFIEKTEEIISNDGFIENKFYDYVFYIDAKNENIIRQYMIEIFNPGQMSFDISIVAPHFIPPQYKSVWRNQTTI